MLMHSAIVQTPLWIPAPLVGAVLQGDMTGLQTRIVLVVWRLRQALPRFPRRLARARYEEGVRISHEGLARELGMRVSGNLTDALRRLVNAGVLVVVDPPSGRRPAAYMIEMRPERWRGSPRRPRPPYDTVRHSPAVAQLAG